MNKLEIQKLINQTVEKAELVGLAKCLDLLWENSYNVKRMDERIKIELEYYFGKNWSSDMYNFVKEVTGEKTTARLEMPKTLKELNKKYKKNNINNKTI